MSKQIWHNLKVGDRIIFHGEDPEYAQCEEVYTVESVTRRDIRIKSDNGCTGINMAILTMRGKTTVEAVG